MEACKSNLSARKRDLVICLLLALFVILLYWQVKEFKFVYYDDDVYVTEKAHVMSGLTWDGVKWALSATESGFWHPLTWISLMIDRDLFGYNAGGFHWSNVILHIINTLLLFFLLKIATGAPLQSASVALLFAIHPLHVESVAWVSQRKDLLCTMFGFVSFLAYVKYAASPNWRRYLLVVIFFVLGLMSKPMVVTFPFVMLLMDYWPLQRIKNNYKNSSEDAVLPNHFSKKHFSILFVEKIPLIILSIIASILVIHTENKVGALTNTANLDIALRCANVVVSYVKYIAMMLFPSNLAFLYPYPNAIPAIQVLAGSLVLLSISAITLFYFRQFPYLFVGWFWYLGTLFPVSGIVQVGPHALADRYTYVPFIGLFIIFAWGMVDWAGRMRVRRIFLGIAGMVIVISLSMGTWLQIGYWRNSIVLFERALKVTSNNYIAMNNLGFIHVIFGDTNKGGFYIEEAIKVKPDFAPLYHNMGVVLYLKGNNEKAIKYLIKARELGFVNDENYRYLGDAYVKAGEYNLGLKSYRRSLSIKSENLDARLGLARVLQKTGQYDDAIREAKEIIANNSSDMRVIALKMLMAISLETKLYQNVISEGERALAVGATDPEIYYMMSSAYQKMGEINKSKLSFDSFQKLNKNSSQNVSSLPSIHNPIKWK